MSAVESPRAGDGNSCSLAQALKDAAQSLETIAKNAGNLYDTDGYENLLEHHDQVRGYAASRAGAARAALAAAPAAAPAWQPIETAPTDGRKLILFYLNRNGKARTVMARWVTDEEAAETDADGVGLEGGWYECIDNWDEYSQVTITEGEPSRWMALPANPGFLSPATGDAA